MAACWTVQLTANSKANEDSILAVQVFDQKKFKKKDQGFLGVINIRIGDAIELAPEADGRTPLPLHLPSDSFIPANTQPTSPQTRCSRGTSKSPVTTSWYTES